MRQSKMSGTTLSEEQRRACPVCGELKTLRGLHGHLRLKHHKQEEEILELVSQAPLDQGREVEEIFTLLDRLEHLNERSEKLEILEERNCFKTDELRDLLFESIQGEAQELVDRLSRAGVILHGEDLEALCTLSRLEQEEQLEEGEEVE